MQTGSPSLVRRLLIWIVRLPILFFKFVFGIYTTLNGGHLYEIAAKNQAYRRDLSHVADLTPEERIKRQTR